ncbi:MAG: DUF3488 domain-containing protein [Nitrospira sp.]|nr:DUF3488 domain-containing protein [Nitrospiraceae bacterium]MBX3342369.1 DUF3488 domain-containing protein [Nitrospira sp.]
MSLDRAFRLSSILLAGTSFASLGLAMLLPTWLLILGSAAFAVALVRLIKTSGVGARLSTVRFSALTWNIFLLLAFAGFWADLIFISQELLPAGIHFLVTLLINKLFNLEHRRDFQHLYAISLMAILASAALTSHVWYAPIFIAYLLSGVWTLLLYHLTKEREEQVGPDGQPLVHATRTLNSRPISLRFFWTTNAVAAGAFCLTLMFFFAIPRIGVGFFQKGRGDSLRTTGFTEHVDLGMIGPVKHDPSVVMRVELPEGIEGRGKAESLYLRGVAYDQYNGKSWSNSLLHRRTLMESPQGTFTVRATTNVPPPPATARLRQDILLEPLDTPVIFGAPLPVTVIGDFLSVQSDPMSALYLPFPSNSRLQYSVYSMPRSIIPADQKATAFLYSEFIQRHYLQLPPTSPQVSDLAHSITKSATSIAHAVSLIRTHLLTSYRYSLEIPATQSARPLEDFLFDRRTGYCEHYATAMVVLLRSVGIPARLVTGFLATEWNGFGSYYTVRQRDAHAWVEVYFPQSGWVTMDPTPSAPAPAPSSWWQATRSALDSVRLKWDRLFVHYSASDQMAMVQNLRESGDAMRSRLADSFFTMFAPVTETLGRSLAKVSHVNRSQALLMAAILLAGIGYLLFLTRRRSERPVIGRNALTSTQQTAVVIYQDLLVCCSRQGLVKAPATTPLEFLGEIKIHWSEALPSAEALTQLYTRSRFGLTPMTAGDLDAARQLLQTLQALTRPIRPEPKL